MTERLGSRIIRKIEYGIRYSNTNYPRIFALTIEEREKILVKGNNLSSDYSKQIDNLERVLSNKFMKPAAGIRRETQLQHLQRLSTQLDTGLEQLKRKSVRYP